MLLRAFARTVGGDFKRVQFTPDLLPSDLTGINFYNQKTGEFEFRAGPLFTNFVLADEINRATPRTQSALLEGMEERQISIDGESYPLPKPFLVLATQNPVEAESTFRLPAAQMDRFLIRLSLGYPDHHSEMRMLENLGDRVALEQVEAVTCATEILAMQQAAWQVHVSEPVLDYIVSLCEATRNHPQLMVGASPRGSRALYKACKVWAAMDGRDFVTPDDVKALVQPVLGHRLLLTAEARFSGRTAEQVLTEILSATPVELGAEALLHEL